MSDQFLKVSDFGSAQVAIALFEPSAWVLNAAAQKTQPKSKGAKALAVCEYLLNPLDRLAQVAAAPLFTSFSHCYQINKARVNKESDWKKRVALAPLTLVGSVIFTTSMVAVAALFETCLYIAPWKIIDACYSNRPQNFFKRRQVVRENDFKTNNFTYLKISIIANENLANSAKKEPVNQPQQNPAPSLDESIAALHREVEVCRELVNSVVRARERARSLREPPLERSLEMLTRIQELERQTETIFQRIRAEI